MRSFLVAMAFVAVTVISSPQYVFAQETREQLLESALINRYQPLLDKQIHGSYFCTSIVNIRRLGEPNQFSPHFEVQVRTVTFTGAHNPPYDLITADIVDDVNGAKIVRMVRVSNVSNAVVKAQCEQEKVKRQLHTHQFAS